MQNYYLHQSLSTLPSISLVGEVIVPAPNKHFRRTPTDWILYLVAEGQMELQEDQTLYHLCAGDVLLLTPGKTHFGIRSNHNIHYYYIHFQWDNAVIMSLSDDQFKDTLVKAQSNSLEKNIPTSDPGYLLLPKYSHLQTTHMNELINDFTQLNIWYTVSDPYQQANLNCMFLLLLIKICQFNIFSMFPAKLNGNLSVLPLMNYLKEHYTEKITSRLLEKEFHHNFDYMNRKFKHSTGYTIFTFLEQYRIKKAKNLLASKQFTITEIAEQLGYCNGFYFSKQFKKYEHVSPREYQQSLK